MTLASQGIFLPKKQLQQHFLEAHASLKHVAKEVKGQLMTIHFNHEALAMKKYANQIDFMTKSQCLDALEQLRHEYYEAADQMPDQIDKFMALKLALATHKLIKKERNHD